MKTMIISVAAVFLSFTLSAQGSSKPDKIDPSKKVQVLEASCGQCNFGMKGKSCDLAVRLDGKTYFVDGTSINDYGGSHAEDGFCMTIRKAAVQGELVNNRFKVTYFTLLPLEKKED